jgi:hypothetical protein
MNTSSNQTQRQISHKPTHEGASGFRPGDPSALNQPAKSHGHVAPEPGGALSMPGATSGDIYNASAQARPMQGETSNELRSNRTQRSGLEGRGATATTSEETVEGRARALGADLPEGVEKGGRGKESRAEGEENASAAEVAAEKARKG